MLLDLGHEIQWAFQIWLHFMSGRLGLAWLGFIFWFHFNLIFQLHIHPIKSQCIKISSISCFVHSIYTWVCRGALLVCTGLALAWLGRPSWWHSSYLTSWGLHLRLQADSFSQIALSNISTFTSISINWQQLIIHFVSHFILTSKMLFPWAWPAIAHVLLGLLP